MKKTKTLLVSRIARISDKNIYGFSNLPYTKIILLYTWKKSEVPTRLPKNIEIFKCPTFTEINKQINIIFETHVEYLILPDFFWDSYSKYNIKIYNKTFWTEVNSKIFKEKDKMREFLWEFAHKKHARMTYKDLLNTSYESLSTDIWDNFIVKPINASSSTNTFKITWEDNYNDIKSKLSKTYEYIVEEYIWWNLFSLDFFFESWKMYLLVLAREVAMIELSDKEKFSNKFIEKYWEELKKHFNFILPLSYHIDFSKLSQTELDFLEKVRQKLDEVWYKWIIHLEYKYDSKTKQIWFLEWWARFGWYRKIFVKEIYHTDHARLPYYLLIDKDYSRFTKLKWNIFKFKEKEYDLNFVRVKTNFIDTRNYISILKKSWDIFHNSFSWFLKNYYENKFWIKIKKIDFFVKYDKNYNFSPFYKNNNTKFDYILELDDSNFKLFKTKKFKIIEDVFFHDYN